VVEADYTIVYLHSGMQPGISLPAAWLYRVWQSLDRAYKKNLKALYVVHPSVWVRVVIALCRPFVRYVRHGL
jgi:Rho GTPase-activating protein 1